MPLGLVPSNDRWDTRWFESLDTTGTFRKGELVGFRAGYQLSVMSSAMSAYVGVALSASTASIPVRGLNMVAVAIPLHGACAWADVDTGVVASAMSVGKKITIQRAAAQGTTFFSFASTVMGEASRFSAHAQVMGPIDADLSRVEVAMNVENCAFYSTSSTTFAT